MTSDDRELLRCVSLIVGIGILAAVATWWIAQP